MMGEDSKSESSFVTTRLGIAMEALAVEVETVESGYG
jgi:hypothetical protein